MLNIVSRKRFNIQSLYLYNTLFSPVVKNKNIFRSIFIEVFWENRRRKTEINILNIAILKDVMLKVYL